MCKVSAATPTLTTISSYSQCRSEVYQARFSLSMLIICRVCGRTHFMWSADAFILHADSFILQVQDAVPSLETSQHLNRDYAHSSVRHVQVGTRCGQDQGRLAWTGWDDVSG